MAWIQARTQNAHQSWRVMWRESGTVLQQTFDTQDKADDFKALVEAHGNKTPRGWILGKGYPEDNPDQQTVKFRDYAETTLAARQKADERTKADYRAMLERHVYPVIGDLPVDRIDRYHVAKIAETLRSNDKSAKTIANVHSLLSSILADAVADQILRRNPAKGALPNLPDAKTEEMCFLTQGEFAHILEHVNGDTYKALTLVLAGTGLRWSEATALRVADVDILGRKTLTVSKAWKRREGRFEIGTPKTNRSRRTIGLSTVLLDALIPLVSARQPNEYVFTTKYGHPVRHSNFYNRVWLPTVEGAQLCTHHADVLTKSPRIHDLRHTHASWLIDAGVSLVAIQRRLGHESITTTIDRYGHLAPEHVDEINHAVDAVLTFQ